ncbi:MAG: dienelactone hydrolase family protein [Croceitalea sp.]|nr:dienelactone hydrolase family protein [Croceitalea sp.]
MFRPLIIAIVFASLCSTRMEAQDFTAYEKHVYINDGDTLPYRMLLPVNYDTSKKYPLVLFLHGSGERGNDNESQLTHGANLFVQDSVRTKYPAIVVFPQCSANGSWTKMAVMGEGDNREFVFYESIVPTRDMELLESLIVQLKNDLNIDRRRMYVGGLSMGGMGTFELVRRNPKMFSAAFPICGGANTEIAKKLKKLDWWVFHGEEDKLVPNKYSTQMVKALQAVGANVTYSLYPNVGHNSWDYAFAEPQLLSWLFSHSK